jgi:hypothetical protein
LSAILDASPVKYYGEHLSENIARTPEGYLVCKNAVIGRTGAQKYLVSELTDPEGLVKDMGPGDEVEVWREPNEVFSDATLSSFNGKTFTLRHPKELLGPDDEREHHVGHVQHVRKGDEPLDSGDWPILADIIVTDADGIRAIANGDRQLSCGYSYRLYKVGDRLEQRQIIGNHVALVESARAGKEARINDSAFRKEIIVKNPLKHLFGLGLKEYSKTTDDPEQIATMVMDAMPAMTTEEGKAEPPESQLDDDKKRARDDDDKKRKAKDDMKSCDDDRHSRMHRALDLVLGNEAKKKQAADVDLDELGKLLGEYFQEEKAEPEHSGDAKEEEKEEKAKDKSASEAEKEAADDEEEVKPIGEAKAADDDEEEKKEKSEDSEIVHPEPELEPKEREESQMDEAAARVALKRALNSLRPFIARSKDKKLIAAFDNEVKKLKVKGGGDGSYAEFAKAAERSSATDQLKSMGVDDVTPLQKAAAEFDDMYKKTREARLKSFIRAK